MGSTSSSLGSALGTLGSRPKPAPPIARVSIPALLLTTPTPSPYPTPTLIAPAIGPVPANCPQGSPLVDFDPTAITPGIGGPDVWLVAGTFDGAHVPAPRPRATLAIGSLRPSDYTSLGWPIQVMVLIKFGFIQPIILTGRDLRTGYSLWLSPDANNPGSSAEATPTATIDPSQLPSSTGHWHIWFGVLYLPGAGCDTLRASWPTGGWTINFAAGR